MCNRLFSVISSGGKQFYWQLCLSFCLSICLCLSVCLSISPSVCLCLCLCVHLFVCQRFYIMSLSSDIHETYTKNSLDEMLEACTFSGRNGKGQGQTGRLKFSLSVLWSYRSLEVWVTWVNWVFTVPVLFPHAYFADLFHMCHKYNPWGDDVQHNFPKSKAKVSWVVQNVCHVCSVAPYLFNWFT